MNYRPYFSSHITYSRNQNRIFRFVWFKWRWAYHIHSKPINVHLTERTDEANNNDRSSSIKNDALLWSAIKWRRKRAHYPSKDVDGMGTMFEWALNELNKSQIIQLFGLPFKEGMSESKTRNNYLEFHFMRWFAFVVCLMIRNRVAWMFLGMGWCLGMIGIACFSVKANGNDSRK